MAHRALYDYPYGIAHCYFKPSPTLAEGFSLSDRAQHRKLICRRRAGLLFVDSVEDGAWLYGHALTLGLEGVVGKRAGAVYQSGERSRDWVKIKRPGAVPPQRFTR